MMLLLFSQSYIIAVTKWSVVIMVNVCKVNAFANVCMEESTVKSVSLSFVYDNNIMP